MNQLREPMQAVRTHRTALFSLAVTLVAIAVIAWPAPAHAESPFVGKWKLGPMHEQFTVQTWFAGCGPAPVPGTTGGGEIVTISEDGDELVIAGGGRTFRTNQCYDQLPTLARTAHTREPSGRVWRTRCSTPEGDPRRAQINTLVAATSDTHLEITETGRYDIVLAEGRCVADIKRSRSLDALAAPAPVATPVTPPAPVPKPTPVETPKATCESPGEPARLEVRPSRKLLRTGESFAFHAIVRDASGCVTPTPTTWSITAAPDGAKRAVVEGPGRVTVPADATEGEVELVATAAGKNARVRIVVTSAAHYDALLAQSGLNAAGESDGAAVALLATESIGGGDAKAEDGARRRRVIFVVIVGVIVVALGVVALVGARRSKRATLLEAEAEERHADEVREAEAKRRARAEEHAAQVRAHEESVQRARLVADASRKRSDVAAAKKPDGAEMVCPACRREYPGTSLFCPHDGGKLVPLGGRGEAGGGGVVCPTCRRGFSAGTRFCPFDKDELVPYAMAAPSPSSMAFPARGKICPTCGGRFDGNASFCGKDGTALVLLN